MIAGLSIAQLCIAIVIIAACVAIVYVALNRMGVAIPGWVAQIFWILIVAFVCIAAIRLVVSF